MLTIVPLVRPYRGLRGMDSFGSGVFGASRDGGSRRHLGRDFIASLDDEVVAPFRGTVVQIGRAYADAELGSIHLQGDGEYAGWRAKILYARADTGLYSRSLLPGDIIGYAQDVASYHKAKQPMIAGDMVNHVHFELWITEPRAVDPMEFMPDNLPLTGGLRT